MGNNTEQLEMKNTISRKYIVNYIIDNYGEMRHNEDAMIQAIRSTAKAFDLNKKDLFHYIIERSGTIPMAQSYGFDTSYGREIRDYFTNEYYESTNNI
jgi:hypothetical protein